MHFPVISILIVLILTGAALYLVNQVLPAPQWVKTTINVVAAVFVLLFLLNITGLWSGFRAELR